MEVNSLYVKKDMSISRDQSAAMKGLMISLIVLGHCRFFSSAFPTTWEWLYCFHVTGFFILPWFYGNNEFSWTQVTKYAKRLLWPYAYMFIFLFLLNYAITHTIICDSGVFNTFFTGNFYKLRQYTGFQYIWFLPAMFSMMVLKDLLYIVNKYWKIVIIVLGAIFFLTCWVFMWRAPYPSFINHKMASFSVLSFMIGFAMMFLGFITRKIMEKWTLSSFFLVVIMIIGLIAMILTSSFQNFNYVKWVCRIVCPIAFFALLFRGGV